MRKAFIFALLAASAAMPTVAMAQEDGTQESRQEARQQNRAERQQARQQRQQARQAQPAPEQRQERQQSREENRAERQQARQRQQQQPVVQQRQEVRQEQRQQVRQERAQQSGEGWMGDPNDPRMEEHRRRYERIERQNARRNGTSEQYRSVVEQQRSQDLARREDRRDTRNDRRDNRQDWRNDRRDNRQDWRNDRRDDRQDWRRDNRQERRNWNRGWRNDNRYDWQRYRNSNRFAFRIEPYYAPYRGYGYSRFGIGQILDRLFWGQNYWISDPWQYRLPPAPYGYQWVRYYNDVVLVDTYNGEIVDVIHDFFW